jgi:23S rRNA (guanosine2251-2'-O)-methyltransferase
MSDNSNKNIIYGKHSVLDAISSIPGKIEKVVVLKSNVNFDFISKEASQKNIVFEIKENKRDFDKSLEKYFNKYINHQNIYAFIKPYVYFDFEKLLVEERENSIILFLCNITDVSNFGAIIRSALAFGVNAIVIPKDRSVEVNATVYKTSSGCASKIRISRITNLARGIEMLQKAGYWSYAADMDAEKKISEIKFPPKLVLAIGSENSGIGHGVLKKIDERFKIPISKEVQSLNASVAAGICLFYACSSLRA